MVLFVVAVVAPTQITISPICFLRENNVQVGL